MARGEDQFQLRFPSGLRDRLKVSAAQNRRSMNSEIILAIEHWLASQEKATAGGISEKSPLPSPSEHAALLGGKS